jgi:hypothetical protein
MVKMFSIKGKIMNDNIGRRFLEEVDSYIKDNLRPLQKGLVPFSLFSRLKLELWDLKG